MKIIAPRLRRQDLSINKTNVRKSNASTEMNTQRTSRERPVGVKKDSSFQWPIKNVKHLAYQRTNRLGRVCINL